MEYKRNAEEKKKKKKKKMLQRRRRTNGNVERRETREFALLWSTLDTRFLQWRACVRILDVIHVCMYTVSSRVRRNDWSRKFLLSAQALKFLSRVLSLSEALSPSIIFFSLFHFVSVFLFFLAMLGYELSHVESNGVELNRIRSIRIISF